MGNGYSGDTSRYRKSLILIVARNVRNLFLERCPESGTPKVKKLISPMLQSLPVITIGIMVTAAQHVPLQLCQRDVYVVC